MSNFIGLLNKLIRAIPLKTWGGGRPPLRNSGTRGGGGLPKKNLGVGVPIFSESGGAGYTNLESGGR